MSGQVLTILVSARLSGLVYKVLMYRTEHYFEFEFSIVCSLSVSPYPSPSLCFLCIPNCLTSELYTVCIRNTLPHNVFFYMVLEREV